MHDEKVERQCVVLCSLTQQVQPYYCTSPCCTCPCASPSHAPFPFPSLFLGEYQHQCTNAKYALKHNNPNASSSYSAAGRTDNSDDGNGPHAQSYGYENNYSQYTPYNPGAGGYGEADQPVIRDVSARRNTKIENPTVYPQQGNSGIAQNF